VNSKRVKNRSDDSVRMFVGLDLHKNYLQAAVVDDKGTLLKQQRIPNQDESIESFFGDELKNIPNEIVIESSSTWYHVYELLSKMNRQNHVVLSNPVKTKAIASAKVKTDKIDAFTLADLLRGGYIPESYIPPRHIMDLREMVRYRASLVRARSSVKNKIHAILLMKGIKIKEGIKPFTRQFVEELKQIGDYRIDGYLHVIQSLNEEINEISNKIKHESTQDESAKLLMSIPGVGYYSALLISSEIGDINRFSDSHHLCSYAGLTPSTHSSGGVTYHGSITRTGSKYLRWILTECVHAHIRLEKESDLTKFYKDLAKRRGLSKAAVAAASKLLRIIYWMLKEKRSYYS
jgi:transposase